MTNVMAGVGVDTEPTLRTESKTGAIAIERMTTVIREEATVQSAQTGTNLTGMGVKKEALEHLYIIVLPEIRVTDE